MKKIEDINNLACPLCGRTIKGIPIEMFNAKKIGEIAIPLLELLGYEVRKVEKGESEKKQCL